MRTRTNLKLRVLVGCESSGIVRDAFAARGHEAWSVDWLPTERPGNHIQGSIIDHDIVKQPWDLFIVFPDCTFLAVSGARHQVHPWRQEAKIWALAFVKTVWAFPIKKVCLEQPVSMLNTIWKPHTQVIQPNQFGHDASKTTHLWLRNLPPLRPTQSVPPRYVKGKPRWANQTDSGQNSLGPSDDRAMNRARTFTGVADAMADQWG